MFRFGKRSFLSARPRSFPGLVSSRWFFNSCIEIHLTCTTQQILTYGSGFWKTSWISISDQMTYFCRRIFKPSISSVLSPILRKQGLFKKANEWRAPMLEWSFCCQDTEVKMHLSSSTPLSELTVIKMVNCFQEITMNRCNSISRNNIRNLDNMAKVWVYSVLVETNNFFWKGVHSRGRSTNILKHWVLGKA